MPTNPSNYGNTKWWKFSKTSLYVCGLNMFVLSFWQASSVKNYNEFNIVTMRKTHDKDANLR